MAEPERLFERMGIKALFLVWGAPQGSHRSELIARLLGLDIKHIYIIARQGKLLAPFKYTWQFFATLFFLARNQYELVFVQDPPIFAVLTVYFFGLFQKTYFIIDSHTDALQALWWKWTLPLHRFLERRAITTIVTNDRLRDMVVGWGQRCMVLEDPPIQALISEPTTLPGDSFKVVMVSTADYDEPVQEVVQVAASLADCDFYITGDFKHSRHHQGVIENAPPNVHFTGYLREGFMPLLNAANVIICLTSEDNTFLSGNNEALWLGKPLITSDWPILRRYFSKGTIYVDNSVEQIRQSVIEMRQHLGVYQSGILELQQERRREWWSKVDDLVQLVQQKMKMSSEES